ncbi:hypothetical protein K8353_40310, partial [Burkholderia contaminans]|nr:hypothetical protein [Burkholderia contaminans]
FFDKNGFMKFDSPILSGNAAEDSTELFETDYFGTPAYLSQSSYRQPSLYHPLLSDDFRKSYSTPSGL